MEKLIIIKFEEETLDSFSKEFSPLGLHFYCVHNGLKIISVLEFEAFVYVDVQFK